MPISTATRGSLLDLMFMATAWANYAQNNATAPHTNIGFSLQTADPGIAGTMSTSETTYTSYTRVNVARTSSGFVRSTNSVSPIADINFPTGTGGAGTLTNFSCGSPVAGAQPYLFTGTLTPSIPAGAGVKPILLNTTAITLT